MLSLSWPTVYKDGCDMSSQKQLDCPLVAGCGAGLSTLLPKSSTNFFCETIWTGGGCWCVTGVLCECWLGRLGSASGSLALTHLYLLFVVLMAALLITVYQCVVGRQIHCREKKEQKNVRLLLLTMYQTSTSCYVYNVWSLSCWLKWGKYFHCPVLTRTSQKQLALQPREEWFD